jgi:hypothetical protein
MKVHVNVIAGLLAIVSFAIPTAAWAARETRWMSLHAEVSVGEDGRVTNAMLLEDKLSQAIKSTVVDNLKKWRFEPVISEGTAVPALTYVEFEACAIPSGDGYDLAIHYIDNGPLLDRADELEFTPALSFYSNDHQSIKVRLTAMSDGHAELRDVVMVDVAPMVQRDMRAAIKSWVKTMRFKPEQIGGRAVATDLEWPFDLEKRPVGTREPNVDVANNVACKSARAAGESPHSLNSPLKRNDDAKPSGTTSPKK